MTFLTVGAINKRYGTTVAVDRADLLVPERTKTAIVGPSGSGKTTLLRLIAGFEAPDTGSIILDGEVLADGKTFIPAHKRSIGVVAQDGALFPHLSVAENIGFGLDRRTRNAETIFALMDTVELSRGLFDRRPHELSGGQQQRVALARALARHPKLMLLDEPFSALDSGLREAMRRSVGRTLGEAGITTILVTHDQTEALTFADQVVVLREGRVIQAGTPKEVYSHPKDAETALFLGDAILLPALVSDGCVECVLGRIPAAATAGRGRVDIMLRSEQLRLASPTPDSTNTSCRAQVTSVEFAGSQCSVSLRVSKVPEGLSADARSLVSDEQVFCIRTSAADLPPRGAEVCLLVSGPAHVFGAPKVSPDVRLGARCQAEKKRV